MSVPKLLVMESSLNYKVNRTLVTKSLKSSTDSYEMLMEIFNDGTFDMQEECNVIALNQANMSIGFFNVSRGGMTHCTIDPKIVFHHLIKLGACGFIIAHNHPSGNLKPSVADREITKRLKEGSALLDINFVDHLILTRESFYSFADNGLV